MMKLKTGTDVLGPLISNSTLKGGMGYSKYTITAQVFLVQRNKDKDIIQFKDRVAPKPKNFPSPPEDCLLF